MASLAIITRSRHMKERFSPKFGLNRIAFPLFETTFERVTP
jgi:hypothetical protein